MTKYILFFLAFTKVGFAEEVNLDPEIALEELFTEEDLAALKEDEEGLLFDVDELNDTLADTQGVEELFQ